MESDESSLTVQCKTKKGKLLLKNEEFCRGKGHTETYLKYFDDHRCLSQSEESKCM